AALVATAARAHPLAPVDPDARLAVPVHRDDGGLDDRRARAPAVDRLRAHAHRCRLQRQRLGRQRRLHHHRLLRALPRRRHRLPRAGSAPAGSRSRSRRARMIYAVWYAVVAVMLTAYVVLDGFDFGVGMAHLFVARSDDERRLALGSIGPIWDGNEVWLV